MELGEKREEREEEEDSINPSMTQKLLIMRHCKIALDII